MKSITLTLPYPISANRYWATRVITPKADAPKIPHTVIEKLIAYAKVLGHAITLSDIKTQAGKPLAMTYVTPEAKAYKAQVLALARVAGVTAPITGRVAVQVRLFPHRPLDWKTRMRKLGAAWDDTVQCIDLDNANKVVLDSLKGVVMEDDKWVRKIDAELMEPDANGARVVLTITALAVEQPQMELCA